MESLAVSLLAALAALPFAIGAWRAGARSGALLSVAGWVALVVLASTTRAPRAVVPESAVATRPIEDPTEGYVTSRACRSCHPGEYASWRRSHHRSMTQRASPESVLGRWSGRLEYGYWYELEQRGDAYWVASNDPGLGAGASPDGAGSERDPHPRRDGLRTPARACLR